jgi:hypothetical protein
MGSSGRHRAALRYGMPTGKAAGACRPQRRWLALVARPSDAALVCCSVTSRGPDTAVLGGTAGRHGVDGTAWYPRRPSIDSGAVSGGAAAPVQLVLDRGRWCGRCRSGRDDSGGRRAVHGGRQPDDRGSDAALGHGEGRVLARNRGGRGHQPDPEGRPWRDGRTGRSLGDQPPHHPAGLRCLAPRKGGHYRCVRPRHGLAHRGTLPGVEGARQQAAVDRQGAGTLRRPVRHVGTFRPIRIRSVLADGDTVIVLWDGHGIANDDEPCENSYAWFMRLRDGQVVDGTPSTTASPSMTSGVGSSRRADGSVVVPAPTGELHPVRYAAWSGT